MTHFMRLRFPALNQ
ncbi:MULTISPECIES: erythromycin resistance leader peptide [Bacillaceae]|uniref:Uncharacterized protein n=1 Tax=Bacillus yapensis TaxID=2492960 RepID=A0A3S0KDR2_9BACI|nr:hypothetical protein EKG37_17035 [Bacillus yapensis]TKS94574.1 hypothetical protein FAR12_17035 [Bacillus yapensis]